MAINKEARDYQKSYYLRSSDKQKLDYLDDYNQAHFEKNARNEEILRTIDKVQAFVPILIGTKDKSWAQNVIKVMEKKLTSSIDLQIDRENELKTLMSRPIDDLYLTHRTKGCLKAANIYFIGTLAQKSQNEIIELPHLGQKGVAEILKVLTDNGLPLWVKLYDWVRPK